MSVVVHIGLLKQGDLICKLGLNQNVMEVFVDIVDPQIAHVMVKGKRNNV
jgi:hypothetical protein